MRAGRGEKHGQRTDASVGHRPGEAGPHPLGSGKGWHFCLPKGPRSSSAQRKPTSRGLRSPARCPSLAEPWGHPGGARISPDPPGRRGQRRSPEQQAEVAVGTAPAPLQQGSRLRTRTGDAREDALSPGWRKNGSHGKCFSERVKLSNSSHLGEKAIWRVTSGLGGIFTGGSSAHSGEA